MVVLVTGATGKIGSELVKQLAHAGTQVRALVHSPDKAETIKGSNVDIVIGDLAKPEILEAAVEGVERVFSLVPSTPNLVELETNLLNAIKLTSVQHIVKLSAIQATENSPASLFRDHWLGEQRFQESGIPFTLLRPNAFNQNLLVFAQSIKSENTFSAPLKDTKVGFIDTRDIALVAAKVLTENGHEGKTYTITGSELLSYQEVAEKLSAILDKKITYVDVTLEDFNNTLLSWGIPDVFAKRLVEAWGLIGDGKYSFVTHTFYEITNNQPRSFDQFLYDYAHVFKNN
ncbi:MAG: SDR family oxidoreductase [Nostoc sp.]|uniref:SDR family oxidoreductase n=1 Tax=Nostoc sp. TaxID=1180 RepID=UPI002FF97E8F